jgi:shikimate kinase
VRSRLPAPPPKTLVIIFGPPAVGKMTVGDALARRTGLRLFHNHQTIDLALRFFEFGSPPFKRLVSEFRTRIFEEVASSDLPGMIFTYVWAFDDESDAHYVEGISTIFRSRGADVWLVELASNQEERLRRNETEFRLAEKESKRDVAASRERLLQLDASHRLNSTGELDGRPDYLRIDNTEISAEDAAERIIQRFGIAVSAAMETA